MTEPIGCSKCNKSSLSLLLLRPSPIARESAIAPAGSAGIGIVSTDFASVLPTRLPTESYFALRLLRAGFVHVYIPNPPAGVEQWLIFRVTDQADLVPETSANFKKADPSIVCPEPKGKHNATGLKLLAIPRADVVNEVWIAYSPNLWSASIKKQVLQHMANPGKDAKHLPMQKIFLKKTSKCTFSPTIDELKARVLECNLNNLVIPGNIAGDFPFNSLAGELTSQLVNNLQKAAACHPATKAKQLAVVLADPVGIATELNATRQRRIDLLKLFVARPENHHPLMSQNATQGIRTNMLTASHQQSMNAISPLIAEEDAVRSKVKGAQFVPLSTPEDKAAAKELHKGSAPLAIRSRRLIDTGGMGRFLYPDQKVRMAVWAKENADQAWEELAKFYDEGDRETWSVQFNKDVKKYHHEPIKKCEADWMGVAEDIQTVAVFSCHFDPKDPCDPAHFHKPGLTYMTEVHRFWQPAPFSLGEVHDRYMKQITEDAAKEGSVVQKALIGNHHAWETAFRKTYTSTGKKVEGKTEETGMEDKTFDVLKQYHLPGKLSFMTDGFAFMGLGLATSLTAAAISATAKTPLPGWILTKLQHLHAVGQGIEYVREAATRGALHGKTPTLPVLIRFTLTGQDALDYRNAREVAGKNSGIGENQLRAKVLAGETIHVTCLTNTEAVRNLPNRDVLGAAKSGTFGTSRMGAAAHAVLDAEKGKMAIFTADDVTHILGQQQDRTRDLVSSIRNASATNSAAVLKGLTSSLDGRLAMGSIAVQVLGVYYNYNNLDNELSKPANERDHAKILAAKLNLSDSLAGLMGAAASTYSVALAAIAGASIGPQTVSISTNLAAAGFATNLAALAGGFINSYACKLQGDDAETKGDRDVAQLYRSASIAFGMTMLPTTASLVGSAADILVARQLANGTVRMAATRLGAAGAASALGLSITGVGFVLLVAGIGLQYAAFVLTPSDLQRWLARSYFGRNRKILGMGGGRRDDSFPIGDWNAEFNGLLKAFGTSMEKIEAERLKMIETEKASQKGTK